MGDSLLWPAMRFLANVIRSLSITDIMAYDCLRGHAELVWKLRGGLSPDMRHPQWKFHPLRGQVHGYKICFERAIWTRHELESGAFGTIHEEIPPPTPGDGGDLCA